MGNNDICRRKVLSATGPVVVIVKSRVCKGNERYTARAITEDGYPIHGLTAQITRSNSVQQRVSIDRVIERLITKLNRIHKSNQPSVDYPALFAALSPDQKDKLCPPAWRAVSTRQGALTFFERHVTKIIQSLLDNDPNDLAALEKAQTDIVDIVKSNQASRKDQGLNAAALARLDAQAKATADQHIVEANKLYQASRVILNQWPLPEISIPRLTLTKIIPPEQCKALDRKTMVQLAAAMWADISRTPLAVGGILMLCCLLRPAEVCPQYKEILYCGDYGVYGVFGQTQHGTRSKALKTKASHRIVVIPRYAMDAIRARQAVLAAQGYDDDAMRDMYVVHQPEKPYTPANPSAISAYVKDKLEQLGCNDDYWAAVSLLMQCEPDLDADGKQLADPTAYILRRSGCTYLVNCAAAPLLAGNMQIPLHKLVDVLMGHQVYGDNADTWQQWVQRDDNWPLIAQMMETIVLDPDHSAHPAYSNSLVDYSDRICHAQQRRIVRDGEKKMTISIRSHGNDDVTVYLPRHCKIVSRDQQVQSKLDSHMPVIQEVLDPDFYKKKP